MADDILISSSVGTYSEYTQKILNLLPDWHDGRNQRDSSTSKIMNSAVAAELEHIVNVEIPNFKTQKSLVTATVHPN